MVRLRRYLLPRDSASASSLRWNILSGNPSECTPKYRDNFISTRRYNWFTFLPLSLLFQFRKLSNCYFLFIAILVQIPGITPVNRFSLVFPLVFVLIVSELREFLEEWNASRRDVAANESEVPLLVGSKKCKGLCPGDIVKIHRDKFVPSDILILQTSNTDGSAFVETSSLDGETTLRLKRAPACTNALSPSQILEKASIKVVCEEPNADMHTFHGHVETGEVSEDLALINIAWRGSTVRNTDWVIGLVVYSGHDTTILLNLKSLGLIPSKTTQVENQMNRNVLFIFLLQVILCAIAASVGYEDYRKSSVQWYLSGGISRSWQTLFFGYFILLASLIPVSLWVSVEILKLFQSWLIESTERLRQHLSHSPIRCNSKTLHEELGQVTHVFTDKTGTLTSNCMKFVGCAIGDKIFLDSNSEDSSTPTESPLLEFQGVLPPSPSLISQLKNSDEISLLFKCLSLCHTCERLTEPHTGQVSNQSVSPDEAALVSMAAECGYMFLGRPSAEKILVKTRDGGDEEFKLLYEVPFTSERKMMSVIVEDSRGRIFVFSKGADSVMIPKCCPNGANIRHAVDQFSSLGYRTLCCAYKEISGEDWSEISTHIQLKRGHIPSREMTNRSEESDPEAVPSPVSPYLIIEDNLTMIGCTAVEDKLQDGVPETLRALKAAGIKVCMITGDKRETAINIGMSCGLISSKKNVHVMLRAGGEKGSRIVGAGAFVPLQQLQEIAAHRWHPSPVGCSEVREYWMNETRELGIASGIAIPINERNEPPSNSSTFSLVIDGKNLTSILLDKSATSQLVDVLTFSQCEGVIFCRVSPQQKGDIVRLVKNKLLSGYSRNAKLRSTLAIGDGSNDVNMIKIANVGIGISGREGSQAANSADYSISKFSDLYRLLFVHGRWNYTRTRLFISVFLFKNFSFALTQFWFGTVSQFSGQTAYDSTYLMLYNSVFGIIPLFVLGLWDMDLDPDFPPKSDAETGTPSSWKEQIVPKIFSSETRFSGSNILGWCALGVCSSIIVFYGVWYGWCGLESAGSAVNGEGRGTTLWMASILAYTVEVFLVSCVNLWVSRLWSKILIFSILVFNIGIYIAFVFTYNIIPISGTGLFVYAYAESTMGNWSFWLMLLLLVTIAILPLAIGRTIWTKLRPNVSQIITQRQRNAKQNS